MDRSTVMNPIYRDAHRKKLWVASNAGPSRASCPIEIRRSLALFGTSIVIRMTSVERSSFSVLISMWNGTGFSGCDDNQYLASPDHPGVYFQRVPGGSYVQRPCPEGLVFDTSVCVCNYSGNRERERERDTERERCQRFLLLSLEQVRT